MNVRSLASLLVALSLTVGWGRVAMAQRVGSPAEMLGSLKVGQWVKVKGPVQNNFSVMCTEVKVLTGDFLDDDWELTGVVRKIDPQKHTVTINNMTARPSDRAEFQSPSGELKSFVDLRVGMYLQVEGTYLKDGTFLVKEFEDKSEKLIEKPHYRREITIDGRIEKVDPARRMLTVMGTAFLLNDGTRIKSMIK